jgi:RNA polymerase sigma-70 factor (ECF subfamily)
MIERTTEDDEAVGLVARHQRGDADAFGEIYHCYFGRVYTYLRVVLRDEHLAEDIAQEVFVRAYKALDRYEQRAQPFRAWLFTIARNRALDHLRRQGHGDPRDPQDLVALRDAAPLPGEAENGGWLADADLMSAVQCLPLAQRQVLILRFAFDLSAEQVAEVVDSTPEAIRALQYRALRLLRQRLGGLGWTGSGASGERRSVRRAHQRRGHAAVAA